MEGEIINMLFVWTTAIASLFFCRTITNHIAPGTTRLCAFLPVIGIFFYLPLRLNSVHFSGMTSFFISWLANFKLILLAFDKGPLYSDPPFPLFKFILTACVPIKIIDNSQNGNKSNLEASKISKPGESETASNKKGNKSTMNYSVKLMVFLSLIKAYEYQEHFHPLLKMALFCVHIYVVLDVGLAMVAYLARGALGFELEPQFDEPYLATSLQDFWGKRWNLMVTGVLHPTVYLPVRSISGKYLPRKIAPFPAFMASFIVSGLMHEIIFYYLGRLKPTWEVTWFFVIHGVLIGLEVLVKKQVNGRFRLPAVVSRPLTLGLVVTTSFWLFFPPFLRCRTELRSCKEFVAFMEFVVRGRFVGSDDVSCPYF